jgi:SulP family sulfate permease
MKESFPFFHALKSYDPKTFRHDAFAGLTVAVVALPQSMAYAIIAGLNPVYGIYTAIVSAIVGSLMGSSNFLITGPTNAISLLVASGMQDFVGKENFMDMLLLLTFMVGCLQVLCGILKLGKMVNFVSHSVIVGFTCGAGVIIALGQLNTIFGIPGAGKYQAVAVKVWDMLCHLGQTNFWTLGLSLGVMALVIILKRINKNIPGPLIALVGSALLAMMFELDKHGVKLTGEIPHSLPSLRFFPISYENIRQLVGPALPIAIIGLVEAISIAKSIGGIADQKVNANQEFIGQGLANLIPSFFQCYPGSGSFTRSAINFYSGARTRFAGVLSGIFLALILLFFAPYGKYIPGAALAAVIILIGIGMVNPKEIRKSVAAGRSDAIAMWLTFAATILMPDLDWAIYMGIFISIGLYLRDTNSVNMHLLIPSETGSNFKEHEVSIVRSPVEILIIHIEGNLYFGTAEDLEQKLSSLIGQAKVYVLRVKRVNTIDLTSLEVLDVFIRRIRQSGGTVLLCGVRTGLHQILTNTRLAEKIGQEHIFQSETEIFDSTRRAIRYSQDLLSYPPQV